jgi:AraC-like DNA-binding protein
MVDEKEGKGGDLNSHQEDLLENIPKLVKLTDVARRIGVSPRTLHRYVKEEGLIPYYQFAGQIMFRPEDINEFLEKHYFNSRKKKKIDDAKAGDESP